MDQQKNEAKQTKQTYAEREATLNHFKPAGNVAILVILIIVFWPIAIIYACIRSWGSNVVIVNNQPNSTNNKSATHFSVNDKTFSNYMEAKEYCQDNKIPLDKIEAEV